MQTYLFGREFGKLSKLSSIPESQKNPLIILIFYFTPDFSECFSGNSGNRAGFGRKLRSLFFFVLKFFR